MSDDANIRIGGEYIGRNSGLRYTCVEVSTDGKAKMMHNETSTIGGWWSIGSWERSLIDAEQNTHHDSVDCRMQETPTTTYKVEGNGDRLEFVSFYDSVELAIENLESSKAIRPGEYRLIPTGLVRCFIVENTVKEIGN